MKTLCIYHANCADGFAAAWVVSIALENDVEFHPAQYKDNQTPPDVTGRDVVLVDFSYPRVVLEQMIVSAKSVTVLDHHKTAQADLNDLPGATTLFDMDRSGARIAWEYYFPDQAAPRLIRHIEDRDLWRFALLHTREIMAAVFSYPYDFDTYTHLMLHHPLPALVAEGKALERKHLKDLAGLLEATRRPMNIGGHQIEAANVPHIFASDAGQELAMGKPFGATYFDSPSGRQFSLRSTDLGEDVSAIAQKYGGGGHRNAAGFIVSFAQARDFEVMPC